MTRRHLRRAALLLAAFSLAAGLSSCSRRIGWGVVLWSSSEGSLPAGSIVPVYIRSNIEKLYVVGLPKSGEKLELPLWQVELFPSKAKAAERVQAFGPNASLYMVAARDGLPLRKEASNGAKRVYRLREGETVKVLRKVAGAEVSTGGEALAGEWYEVLAEGGASGFVFSYAMRLYDEAKEGPPLPAAAASKQAASGRVDVIFTNSWKPAYYQEMIDDQRVDLDLFTLRYGLYTDAVRRQVRLELPGVSQVFNYSAISEEGGAFAFVDTPLRIRVEGERRLAVSWVESAAELDEEEPEAGGDAGEEVRAGAEPVRGFAGRASFVVLSEEPREAIRLEELRQLKLLEAFVDATGGSWKASPGGSLSITKSRRFAWSGREGLEEGFVPAEAGATGDAHFRLHLDPALAASWTGAFSLRFDPALQGGESGRELRADYLYSRSENGIVLVPAFLGAAEEGGGQGIVVLGPDPRFEPLEFDRKD
ncbi:MAG TPA: SH3 domain-containing protein [Spirochaetia bacterium]|nr:SH3 domain-containing protein [Spirochaetia bacterium]